ncbi:MAG TPA: ribonuclease H-like domain-containing protein [Alphaproteobacteria bacterium]|jgi:ribonuclease D|nr:ribonuclease H-like domain-containing protein [Alphaproteobacteria bacterium]
MLPSNPTPQIFLHQDDLPEHLDLGPIVAIDTETMGLKPVRDRLCLIQMSSGDGVCHLVQFKPTQRPYHAPRLKKMLENPLVTKIFHFARFDVHVLKFYLNLECKSIYCTKIASKLVRTFTDRHGLKDLCKDLLDIELSKQQQSSDWGAETLTAEQLKYAASDVLYLHRLKEKLDFLLKREDRINLAQSCFNFLTSRVELDLLGLEEVDIFAHQ